MAKQTFPCSLITPEGILFEGQVTRVILTAHDGQLAILPNHAPLICRLGAGRLRLDTREGIRTWFVDHGVAHLGSGQLLVLTEVALRPEELNRQHALEMLEEARRMPTDTDESLRLRDQITASARAQLRMIG